ncbi:WhiB family transcriptional regulator [Candidatus Poriferisodalis sp.]|uniref:WhiB family transcriptional regulator n=1 Tax=Candidatus Poriferisodalis sp. TaxID=3101277 RepID=UPI003B01F088
MATTLNQLIALSREAWRASAACKDVDTNIFFIGPGKSPDAALAICNRCEVKDECLQFALDNEEDFGIWGGLNADQRKQLRKRGDAKEPPPLDTSRAQESTIPPEPTALLTASKTHSAA